MAPRGKGPQEPGVGVAADLGLPLAPDKRGRVYRLPPTKRELGSSVEVPGVRLPKEVAISTSVTQAGRIRLGGLTKESLQWEPGQHLLCSKEWWRSQRGTRIPVLILRPAAPKENARSGLTTDNRITIRVDERLHLGLDLDGDAVLCVVRRAEPTQLVLMGERSLGVLLDEGWSRAR